jgi:formate/nitrite transporter FocA (FNT family)
MSAETTEAPDKVEHAAGGAASPHLEPEEQNQAAAHASLRPLVIHEIIREEGQVALSRPAAGLVWSGLAAGLSMGFSFLTQGLLRASLPEAPWRHLIDGFGYSIGFIIVILGRQQLFTESTLTAVLPVLTHRDLSTLVAAARLWAIVLVANLVGTWIFAALLLPSGVFPPAVTDVLAAQAGHMLQGDPAATILKAMFAGWLIALMVWLLPSARSAKLLTVLIITYVVAIGELSHIIAGSVEAAYGVLRGMGSLGAYFGLFLAPTLAGNILGGVAFVAIVNHGSIAPEIQSEPAEEFEA